MEFFGFELRQLQYFVVAAEQSSFSRAAELLFVTQPLISQQISDLEQQLGAELFVRQHHALRLTPAGAALYPEAKAILEQSGSLIRTVQLGSQETTPGVLRVGFEDLYDWPFIVEKLNGFQKKQPNMVSEVSHSNYQTIVHDLFNEKLDVIFALLPNKSLSKKLRVKVIGKSNICLAASRTHTEHLDREAFIAGMDHKPLYLLNGDYRGTNSAIRTCVRLNVSPQFYFLDSMESIILNVAAGNGYAYFPRHTFRVHGGRMLRVEELSGIAETEVCLAAIWVSTNINPILPRFLEEFSWEGGECKTCGQACAVNKHNLAEN